MSVEDDLIFLVKQRIGYTDFTATCRNCSFVAYIAEHYCHRNPDITFEVNKDGTCEFWEGKNEKQ